MIDKRRVVLNTNVYGRLFDELESEELLEEAFACYRIFMLEAAKSLDIYSSDVLFAEIRLIKDLAKRRAVLSLVDKFSSGRMRLNQRVIEAADIIFPVVKDYMDCLHMAFAAVNSCCLVTCDKELQDKSTRIEKLLSSRGFSIAITSPIAYLAEVDEDE